MTAAWNNFTNTTLDLDCHLCCSLMGGEKKYWRMLRERGLKYLKQLSCVCSNFCKICQTFRLYCRKEIKCCVSGYQGENKVITRTTVESWAWKIYQTPNPCTVTVRGFFTTLKSDHNDQCHLSRPLWDDTRCWTVLHVLEQKLSHDQPRSAMISHDQPRSATIISFDTLVSIPTGIVRPMFMSPLILYMNIFHSI